MNFLHLSYLLDNMDILNNDVDNYFNKFKLFIVNSDSNELKLQNTLNSDLNKENTFSLFKEQTGVDLDNQTYNYFMKNEYNNSFKAKYSDKISELFKQADLNSKDIVIHEKKKIGFFSKIFGKKEEPFILNEGIYNASIFNKIIISKLDYSSIYIDELLKLNKFIIFESNYFQNINEKFNSLDFISKYIEIKEYSETNEFKALNEDDKLAEIKSRFKIITESLQDFS